MYRGTHCIIRTIEVDDAPVLSALYDPKRPRAALLDARRELAPPTMDELRIALGTTADQGLGMLHAIEDLEGRVLGFGSLRHTPKDHHFALLSLMLLEDRDCLSPMGNEACGFLLDEAFRHKLFRKVLAQAFEWEQTLRELLLLRGFTSDGTQRDVLRSSGHWHNMETLTVRRPALGPAAA